MNQAEFQNLLQRYQSGNCSEEEIQQINRWFSQISKDELELDQAEQSQTRARVRASLQGRISATSQAKAIPFYQSVGFKVAASVLLVAVALYLIYPSGTQEQPTTLARVRTFEDEIQHQNITGNVLTIQLPDSSRVTLQPGAEIRYAANQDDHTREVHLVGDAFFDVVKDPTRPFLVYGGQIVTKVLGTSFSVNAVKDAESIEVSVHTGRVSVYEDAKKVSPARQGVDATGVVLTPNEKVEYFVHDKHWVTSLVEEPKARPESNKSIEFLFSDTPMSDITTVIEKNYLIDIIIERDALNACTFTGDVSMMELYDMLDVICKSTGTNYEVKGTKILITGIGCE